MFKKVLIANRGEIAVRIARTLKKMGVTSVAVYSDADHDSLHVSVADEAVALNSGGGSSAAETYLRGDRILEIARKTVPGPSSPAMAFCPKTPRSPSNVRRPASSSSAPHPSKCAALASSTPRARSPRPPACR